MKTYTTSLNQLKFPGKWLFCLLLLLGLGVSFSFAQPYLKTLGAPGINEGASTIITAPDGRLLLGGFRSDSAMIMKVVNSLLKTFNVLLQKFRQDLMYHKHWFGACSVISQLGINEICIGLWSVCLTLAVLFYTIYTG